MIETITCDHCHHTFNTDMISVINNTKDQTLKQLVMNGEIFRITCPLCHQRLYHAHSLLYFDSEKKLFLIYSKSQQFFDHMLYIEGQTGLLNDYVVRYVDDFNAFKEKIQIFDHGRDDRLIELYKEELMQAFKQSYPYIMDPVVYYDHTLEERFVVLSKDHDPLSFAFNEAFYSHYENNALLNHALHYDTYTIVDARHMRRLQELKIRTLIAKVTFEGHIKDYAIDHHTLINVGDLCEVSYKGEPKQATVLSLRREIVQDVQNKTPFIERVIPYETQSIARVQRHLEDTLKAIYEARTILHLDSLLRLLTECQIYIPMMVKDGLLYPETMIDHVDALTFIPIFTSLSEIKEFYNDHYVIVEDNFFEFIHQKITTVDGYLINPFSLEIFPIDHEFIKLLDQYDLSLFNQAN